jgi:pimeloyl-ACP methyl ester carboxylesterase
MSEPQLQVLEVGGIRMRVAELGEGPLVLLSHGFPECWRSWRSQLSALAAAGYRAVAPDMRGYGGTDAPPEPDAYTMLHHVGDMVELVRALGEAQATIVGHDWGAAVAWSAALLRPDLFRAVVGMSVPFIPPSRVDFLTALEMQGVRTFYMQYFQAPGVAEAELEADVEASIRRLYFSVSGDGPDRTIAGILAPGAGILANTVEPERLPDWLSEEDIAYVTANSNAPDFAAG